MGHAGRALVDRCDLQDRNSRYMRFPSAAEAIRFAIEEMQKAALPGIAIELGDDRYEGGAIRALYDAPEYPLQREMR